MSIPKNDGEVQQKASALEFDLFGELLEDAWRKEWVGMPEFVQEDLEPEFQILVSFESEEDVREFAQRIGQKITPNAESRLTSKALERLGVPYYIVVEPFEYEKYAEVIDQKKILVLPKDNMKLIGSRCWIMEHSIKSGAERHWQIDDNIEGFYRLNRNLKVPVGDGTIFRCAEDFTDRYENVAYSGMDYFMFAPRKSKIAPYRLNTRIYSCTLVNNSIPYRWRSIYNDDTDVSLCALKDGWCTILFSAFLCGKVTTMSMKGGNTDELYKIEDGRLKMAQALVDLHPDVTKIVHKWGRWQHEVDYSGFKKNRLVKKAGLVIPEGVNNYGMVLKYVKPKKEEV